MTKKEYKTLRDATYKFSQVIDHEICSKKIPPMKEFFDDLNKFIDYLEEVGIDKGYLDKVTLEYL